MAYIPVAVSDGPGDGIRADLLHFEWDMFFARSSICNPNSDAVEIKHFRCERWKEGGCNLESPTVR